MKPVTLAAVAARAKVSQKTASLALQRGRGAPATVARVRAAARELGYEPRRRGSKPRLIVALTPTLINPSYFLELRRSISDHLHVEGEHWTVFYDVDSQAHTEHDVIEQAIRERAAGVLMVSAHRVEACGTRLVQAGIPAVAVSCRPSEIPAGVGHVGVDNVAGVAQAVAGLRRQGHERIGYLHGRIISYSEDQRFEGFKRSTGEDSRQDSFDYEVHLQAGLPPRFRAGYEGCRQLMHRRPPPTAIVAYNDQMAMGCLCFAEEWDIDVPEQLAVVGHDDLEFAAFTAPALSTVRVDRGKLGALAVDQLLARAAGTDTEPETMPTALVERRTARIM